MSESTVSQTAEIAAPLSLRGVIEHFNTLASGRDLLAWVKAGEQFPSARRAWDAYKRTVEISWRQWAANPHAWRAGRDADARLIDLHVSSLRFLMLGLEHRPGDQWRRLLLLDAMDMVMDVLHNEIEVIGERVGPVTLALIHTEWIGGDAG